MPRLTITTLDGTPVARGVYPICDQKLLSLGLAQHIVPAGSFLRMPSPLISFERRLPDGLWLNHHSEIGGWPRTESFHGCCGPNGSLANILHPFLAQEPVAFEIADCYTERAIRLPTGTWQEEIESDEDGETWCAYVAFDGRPINVIGAATGRDQSEACHRLRALCSSYEDTHWHRRSKSWRLKHLTWTYLPADQR